MTLDERTRPYREEMNANLDQLFEVAQWLRENPNAEKELRREKFATWRKLSRENEVISRLWDTAREQWLRSRMNRPASVGEVAPEVLRNVAQRRDG